jgi:hypothetical protein
MLCKNVLLLLSEFLDEIMDAETSVQISQHLAQCSQCRKEFESLSVLRGKLKSLKGIQAPKFLGSLVEHKIAEANQNTWRHNLRNELERYWSKIRTTEGTWYFTKALGTVMTSLFFFLISGNNIPLSFIDAANTERDAITPAFRLQVRQDVLARLGMQQAPRIRVVKSDAAINEIYLNTLGDSMSQPGKDDTVSVLAAVDPVGSATIQNVLERPNDQKLLSNVNEMISSARCRPASENGKAVSSHIVLTFIKVSVYDRFPEVN